MRQSTKIVDSYSFFDIAIVALRNERYITLLLQSQNGP